MNTNDFQPLGLSILTLGSALSLLLFSCSCQPTPLADTSTLCIMSYNVQTFFDDIADGNEFPEFIPSDSGWNSRSYHLRLRNLARVIRECRPGGPDIIILQEIEGMKVLEDLTRFYLADMDYYWAAVNGSGPQMIAVLSRVELTGLSTRGVYTVEAALRPALEARFSLPGGHELIILGVHWKSKRGEEAVDSEDLRRAQAHSIASAVEELRRTRPGALLLIAGDCNESWDEYDRVASAYTTALMPADPDSLSPVDGSGLSTPPSTGSSADPRNRAELRSLRLLAREDVPAQYMPDHPVFIHAWTAGQGSYLFQGQWNSLDHLMPEYGSLAAWDPSAPLELMGEFSVYAPWYLLDSRGAPLAYRSGSSRGFSDHLPVLLEICLPGD